MFKAMILPAISERISTSSFGKIDPVELNKSSKRVAFTTITMTAVLPPFPPGPPLSLPFDFSSFSDGKNDFLIFG